MMRTSSKSFLSLAMLAAGLALLTGCETTEVTNLTPSSFPRNPTGQYMVEMQLDTKQQTMLPDTITPSVVVGFESYPMRRTKKTQNRWEGLIPVPASKDNITYHFKANYEYQGFGKTRPGSVQSKEYVLLIK